MKKNGIDEKKPEQPQAITGEQVYSERNFKHYLKKSKVIVVILKEINNQDIVVLVCVF